MFLPPHGLYYNYRSLQLRWILRSFACPNSLFFVAGGCKSDLLTMWFLKTWSICTCENCPKAGLPKLWCIIFIWWMWYIRPHVQTPSTLSCECIPWTSMHQEAIPNVEHNTSLLLTEHTERVKMTGCALFPEERKRFVSAELFIPYCDHAIWSFC